MTRRALARKSASYLTVVFSWKRLYQTGRPISGGSAVGNPSNVLRSRKNAERRSGGGSGSIRGGSMMGGKAATGGGIRDNGGNEQ